MQPDLRLPGDLFDRFRHPLLSLAQPGTNGGPITIAPGRFNNDPSEMRVACFGDASPPGSLAAGVLRGFHRGGEIALDADHFDTCRFQRFRILIAELVVSNDSVDGRQRHY